MALAAGLAGALGAAAVATRSERARRVLGGQPEGERLARMQRCSSYLDGAFHNTDGRGAGLPKGQRDILERFVRGAEQRRPGFEIPVVRPTPGAADGEQGHGEQGHGEQLDGEALHVTWLGHASALVELDGIRILCDPVWSERCSPFRHAGPRRLHPAPGPLASWLPVDAVVISHDHYDHLDMATITDLASLSAAVFVVPLGVGAHLEAWGVAAGRIVELDWGQEHAIAGVTLGAVEAQHFSGRGLRRDGTLWASWTIAGTSRRVFFSGDTGYFDRLLAIGTAHGPFDAALMAVGMYDPAWPAMHLTPEEAVTAAVDLGAALVLPIHWCTFSLAPHPWAEPVERLLTAADAANLPVLVPRVGERVAIDDLPTIPPWWRPSRETPNPTLR